MSDRRARRRVFRKLELTIERLGLEIEAATDATWAFTHAMRRTFPTTQEDGSSGEAGNLSQGMRNRSPS